MARRKGKRGSGIYGLYSRETDLWTGEDWQPSPMDTYPGEDRFFQAAYNHYGPWGPCFGGFNQKEASDDLAPLLRKMYEDGKRKGTDMTVARQNPIGIAKPKGVLAVHLGRGKLVHCFNPVKKGALCKSGAGRSRNKQPLFKSNAKFVNCYRCAKLMTMNTEAGRRADEA